MGHFDANSATVHVVRDELVTRFMLLFLTFCLQGVHPEKFSSCTQKLIVNMQLQFQTMTATLEICFVHSTAGGR